MALVLTPEQVEGIVAHARADFPNECCGVLVGTAENVRQVYRTKNVDFSPFTFTVDGEELLRVQLETDRNGLQILGFYHSHLETEARPSRTDIRKASLSWPGYIHVIVSLKDVKRPALKAYRIKEDETLTEEEVVVQ